MNDELEHKELRVGTLIANEILLVDKSGRERAALLCSDGQGDDPGHTVLQLFGLNGTPRIELQVDVEGCCIRLNTPDDAHGIAIAFSDNRGTGISVNDHEGKPAISLEVSHPGSDDPRGNHPEIKLTDGKRQRSLTLDP